MPSPFSKGGLDGGIIEQELHMCLQMLMLKFHYQNKPFLFLLDHHHCLPFYQIKSFSSFPSSCSSFGNENPFL